MKFFLDTANLEEIRKAKEWGLLDGVTTNPTLVSKEDMPFQGLVTEILRLVDGPVSLEVVSEHAQGMISEARELNKLGENVVIKIPLTPEGLKAVKILAQEGIKTNVTLCFSPTQALLAAKAGADYISPFIGRLDDISSYGMRLVEDIKDIYGNYGFETQIIVASIRHPMHVLEAALIGADIATMPFPVLEKLFHHPLTDIGIQRFLRDWEKVKARI
ncbi:MAG: fructose-6-phosphate aldolase [Candidatus Omnitrophica bacterium 4484_49]|nr:fructose-6-phosphate aldolase [Candidatus Omnitrophota bacterium]OQX83428.1 MAG: fructose-6-phosphate aldolase [Candidatus Omnitrophica bacterium 4484_49]